MVKINKKAAVKNPKDFFGTFFRGKKGMEMSLNLIIMLIIGMVILGLVITFVQSMVTKGQESFDKQLGDNEKLKLDEVKNCPDNLCVAPYPSVTVKKGDKTNIYIKVRAFGGDLVCNSGQNLAAGGCTGVVEFSAVDDSGSDAVTKFTLVGPGLGTKEGEENAQMYTLKVAKDTTIGTYFATMKLTSGEQEVEKSFTINVN